MDLGKLSQQIGLPFIVIKCVWCDIEERDEYIDATYGSHSIANSKLTK